MVRKQLYIDDAHEEWLKRRAAETGLTEAEIVRQALDSHAERIDTGLGGDPRRRRAADALDAHADRIAARWASRDSGSAQRVARWTREELYAEREDRLA